MQNTNLIKLTIYFLIGLLLLTPFIVTNHMFFPYITGKAYFFRIITEIIFFVWLALAVYKPEFRPQKSWLLVSLTLFIISIFISAILGENKIASLWSNYERMEGFVTWIHLWALFLVAGSVFKEKKQWQIFFDVAIFVNIFFVFQALREIAGQPSNYRVDILIGNSSYVGIYFLLMFFITLFNLTTKIENRSKNLWSWQIFYLIMLIAQSYLLFETGTRGSMLGWAGGLGLTFLIIFVLSALKKELRKTKLFKISAGLMSAFVVIVIGFFILKDSAFIQNIEPLKRLATISPAEGTAKARLLNWQMAWEGVKERPVLGWGQSNYNYVFDKNYLPAMHGNESFFDRAHNFIFDWLIAGGFIGLILFLSVIISALYLLWRKTDFTLLQKSILTGLIASYLFNNLFVFDQIVSYIFVFLILAFIHSQSKLQDFNFLSFNLKKETQGVVSSLILIALPVTIYFVNIPSYYQNVNLLKAVQLTARTEDGKTVIRYEEGPKKNLELYQKALSYNTFGNAETVERLLGTAQAVVNLPEQIAPVELKSEFVSYALQEVQKITNQTDPNNSRYHYVLGMNYAGLGMLDESIVSLEKAISISPNKQIYRMLLIKILMAKGEKEKAFQLAKETYELDKSKNDLLIEFMKVAIAYNNKEFEKLVQEVSAEQRFDVLEKYFFDLIAKSPDKIEPRISLSAIYLMVGDKEKSLEILDVAKKDFPDMSTNLNRAMNEIRAGRNPMGSKF